ncbi:MAG: preprotein translocase subunit SecE [Candidatus Portnoybacteria bacterium]|nr:preprotein translocase subunit SecE [Candidatus Portnoybacteria bacterium]
MFTKIANFFREVRIEVKKVTWPTRQETVRYTLMVIGVSLGVALFLGGLDFILGWVMSKFVI